MKERLQVCLVEVRGKPLVAFTVGGGWWAFPADEARRIAALLQEGADEVEKRTLS